MNSVYSSNNLERCMNSAYIKVVSSIIFDFGFVCCWFYPFWFFEFSVVIRFIIDDSIVWRSLRFSFVLPPIHKNVPEVFLIHLLLLSLLDAMKAA